ncbi:Ras guanine nucleotide exchange factor [Entamoeba marina]
MAHLKQPSFSRIARDANGVGSDNRTDSGSYFSIGDTRIDESSYNADPRYTEIFDLPDTEEYITYTTETGCDFKIIQRATLEKCISVMMSKDFNDNYFQECFILAYRLVTTPENLLELISIMFDPSIPEGMTWDVFVIEVITPLRLKIMNFIRTWMKNAWDDFDNKEELIDKLQQLIDRFSSFKENMAKILNKQLEFKIAHVGKQISNEATSPILKLDRSDKYINVLQFHPMEFAHQITLYQSELFCSISPSEFLNNAWMSKEKERIAPKLIRLIHFSQKIFNFVQTSILVEKRVAYRALLIHYFLVVADHMRKINNFEGMKAIFAGLQSSSIFRLKDSWDSITDEDHQIHQNLVDLCDQNKNFIKLREAIKIAVPPCLPFIGSTLTDLVFTTDGNKSGDNVMINWFKVRSIGNLIKEILIKQSTPYKFQSYPNFVNFFSEAPVLEDENDLHNLSMNLEKKRGEMTSDLEKLIAKNKKEGNARIKKYTNFLSNKQPFFHYLF